MVVAFVVAGGVVGAPDRGGFVRSGGVEQLGEGFEFGAGELGSDAVGQGAVGPSVDEVADCVSECGGVDDSVAGGGETRVHGWAPFGVAGVGGDSVESAVETGGVLSVSCWRSV